MAHRPIKLVFILMLAMLPTPAAFAAPDTVFFPSADGSTEIVAYLFKPQTPGPHPAIVMPVSYTHLTLPTIYSV